MRVLLLLLSLCLAAAAGYAQQPRNTFKNPKVDRRKPINRQVNEITAENSSLLEAVFRRYQKELGPVLAKAEKYRLQIIFTQINRDNKNLPYVKHHTWRLRPKEYFFPASMVKLPTAAMALEKLNRLNLPNLNVDTEMLVEANMPCQTATKQEEKSKAHGYSCLHHCIKDALVVSGNLSYDRLYEFVGPQELNEGLWLKGYSSMQIISRYGQYCPPELNRVANAMTFRHQGEEVLYLPQREYLQVLQNGMERTKVGIGQVDANGQTVYQPRDFAGSNAASLKDLHEVLMAIMLPQVMPKEKRFYLRREDYKLLHRYMSMMPQESRDPEWDAYYTPTRMKYLYYGSFHEPMPGLRIFNKVGQAYGFLTDCAYFADFNSGTEFMLSVTLYCNEDEILNDDKYDYYAYGFQFMRDLGKILLEMEKARKKPYKANLEFYKQDYTTY